MKISVQHIARRQRYQCISLVAAGRHDRQLVFLKDRPDEGIRNKYAQFAEVAGGEVLRGDNTSLLGKNGISYGLHIFALQCFHQDFACYRIAEKIAVPPLVFIIIIFHTTDNFDKLKIIYFKLFEDVTVPQEILNVDHLPKDVIL